MDNKDKMLWLILVIACIFMIIYIAVSIKVTININDYVKEQEKLETYDRHDINKDGLVNGDDMGALRMYILERDGFNQ